MPSTLPGTEAIAVNNATKPCLLGAYFLRVVGSKILKKYMPSSNSAVKKNKEGQRLSELGRKFYLVYDQERPL